MNMMNQILNDTREISRVKSSLIDSPDYEVGRYGVTKIEAYGENGMQCDIPWIRIFKNNELVARINCHCLAAIEYV